MFNRLEKHSVGESEYGFLTEPTHHTAPVFKLHLPTLMSFPMGGPSQGSATFNNKIFANDDSCKPSVSQSLTTQNFLTVPRYFDDDLSLGADPAGILYPGRKFVLHLMYRDVRQVHILKIT